MSIGVLLIDENHALPLQLVADHIGFLVLALLADLITLVYHPDDLVLLEPVLLGSGYRVEEIQSGVYLFEIDLRDELETVFSELVLAVGYALTGFLVGFEVIISVVHAYPVQQLL